MAPEFNQIILSHHELRVITNSLSVYRMYLHEDYDKEDNSFLKDKLYRTIDDVERVMKALLKLDGVYYDI